jgi:hypothetical protein
MPQSLMSAKDQSNFRQVVKFYEAKQYKKGVSITTLLQFAMLTPSSNQDSRPAVEEKPKSWRDRGHEGSDPECHGQF